MSSIPVGWNDDVAFDSSERAYLLHSEGRYKESLALFEGLLDLYPGNPYYMDAIAALYLALDRPEEAARIATDLLLDNPSHLQALVRRSEAYITLRMSQEAEADIQQIRRLGARDHASRMAMRLLASRGADFSL
ncbi:tetratricopeptide repeat protein [Edaphobacter modestus]|uniref:tetratricopeptide repeat protein n=1 Tax=Edaphobacter modestus TaxID=388466 RepID=UPI00102B78B0|nr:tetratricopeptide repeat protein [Edaphobacter modestus]